MTCRGALLADQAALEQWKTSSPLLIMGSHRWNIPNSRGQIACGGERQAKLLQAVRYRYIQLFGLLNVATMILCACSQSKRFFIYCLPKHGPYKLLEKTCMYHSSIQGRVSSEGSQ